MCVIISTLFWIWITQKWGMKLSYFSRQTCLLTTLGLSSSPGSIRSMLIKQKYHFSKTISTLDSIKKQRDFFRLLPLYTFPQRPELSGIPRSSPESPDEFKIRVRSFPESPDDDEKKFHLKSGNTRRKLWSVMVVKPPRLFQPCNVFTFYSTVFPGGCSFFCKVLKSKWRYNRSGILKLKQK
jgi:hypothetical protein